MNLINSLHLTSIPEKKPDYAIQVQRDKCDTIPYLLLTYMQKNNLELPEMAEFIKTSDYLHSWCSSLKYNHTLWFWFNKNEG